MASKKRGVPISGPKVRVSPQPSHENVFEKATAKAQALREFDVDKEAKRMAKRRIAKAEKARKTV